MPPKNCRVVIALNLDNTVNEQVYHIWQALEMHKVIPLMSPKLLRPANLVTPVPVCLFLSFWGDEFCLKDHGRAANKVISTWACLLVVDMQLSFARSDYLK